MPEIARNAIYLYIQSSLGAAAGYAFWLIISRLTGPETVGLASTTIAIATVALSFATLGVPAGLQRFLGRARGENNLYEFKKYLNASLFVVGLSVAGVASFLAVMGGPLSSFISISYEFLIVAIIIVIASGLASTLTGAFIASLRVKTLLMTQVLSSSVRIVSGVALVLFGFGALGVVISNSVFYIVSLVILGLYMFIRLRNVEAHARDSPRKGVVRELLEAGSARWVPGIVYTLGMQLGVIVVFGAFGAFEAGLYFIALAISSIITGIYSSIMAVAFPLLSGMKEGRKKAAWRTVRLSLVFCIPLIIAMITYPRVVLGLFGEEYVAADLTLVVLLLSTIPLIISTGVHTLVYAYGNYRQVFAIGLAGNIPSVLLYFTLAPALGGLGASYAYLGGALMGLTVSTLLARRIEMRIIWLDLAKALSIPLAVGVLAYTANLHWLIGGPIIFLVSLLGYAKLNLITKQDLTDLTEAILPEKVTESIYQRFSWILNILYPE